MTSSSLQAEQRAEEWSLRDEQRTHDAMLLQITYLLLEILLELFDSVSKGSPCVIDFILFGEN
jgi:hypothetical protein